MEVTEVRISLQESGKLQAFANITFENAFVVRGLKVIDGNQGMFVAMPSRKRSDGTYQDTAHPINNDMRQHIEDRVLAAYRKARDTDSRELTISFSADGAMSVSVGVPGN